tara:strand:+ start:248 stop:487 length:240 start_codon:yes stop_codon:yes gene_type:complete
MDYNTLLNKLPKETELHYLSDCTQFFIDNKIKSKKYSNYNYILFEYTTDFPETIHSLNKNNIEYIIKKDSLDLKYILIK